MKIDEAIAELSKVVGKWQYGASYKLDNALKLGIEALKEVRASREEDYIGDTGLLPGETE